MKESYFIITDLTIAYTDEVSYGNLYIVFSDCLDYWYHLLKLGLCGEHEDWSCFHNYHICFHLFFGLAD